MPGVCEGCKPKRNPIGTYQTREKNPSKSTKPKPQTQKVNKKSSFNEFLGKFAEESTGHQTQRRKRSKDALNKEVL